MGIDLRKFRRHHLRELWDALPSGYRLRMGVYGVWPVVYGRVEIPCGDFKSAKRPTATDQIEDLMRGTPALTEARMLAYSNRMVLDAHVSGRDVLCIIAPVDNPKLRAPYKVSCWEW